MFGAENYTPITGNLPFQPAGNALAGAQGGLPGLANQYQQSYNSALGQNEAMYKNIMGGYQNLTSGVLGTIQNVGQAQSQQIADTYAGQSGAMRQSLINRGLGNTTVNDTMQRGLLRDQSLAQNSLADQIAQLRGGYQAQLGGAQLGFMNSVTAAYPNADQYYGIYRDKGMMDQAAKNQALMQQLGGRQSGGGGGFQAHLPPNKPWGSEDPYANLGVQAGASMGTGAGGGFSSLLGGGMPQYTNQSNYPGQAGGYPAGQGDTAEPATASPYDAGPPRGDFSATPDYGIGGSYDISGDLMKAQYPEFFGGEY